MLLAALNDASSRASQRAALVVELDRVPSRSGTRQGSASSRTSARTPRWQICHLGASTRELAASRAGVSARTVQDAATSRANDQRPVRQQVKEGKTRRRCRRTASPPTAKGRCAPAPPALPEGPFELIYADPPWQLGAPDGENAPENHYPTMPLEEIKALAVPAAEDSVLFLWAVASKLPEALEVMRAWGFEYKTCLVWVKDWIGLGTWARHRHELLLLGRRGTYPPPEPEDRPDSVIEAPRGAHSEKPACVYELIERAYPLASKLELFARGVPRTGWTAWGNEVEAA